MTLSTTPPAARKLLIGVASLGVALLTALLAIGEATLAPVGIVVVALAIAGGEALKVDLAYRQGGAARFTLGYAALAAGLFVLPGIDVVIAATGGIIVWQLAERVARFKFAVNVAQYLAGSAAAALAVELLSPRPGAIDARTLVAVVLGIALCCAVNAVTVGGMIATFAGRGWIPTIRQLTPTIALTGGGSVALGLLAILLATDHLWALPTLVVPLALLHAASRREVQAQADRERAVAFVAAEQQLGAAIDTVEVHERLVEGVRALLGCSAAIWADGAWQTEVPAGSGQCHAGADLAVPVTADGAAFGIAAKGSCVAIGLGNGVLVAWAGELQLGPDASEWIERLGASGRVHGARSEAAAALHSERATLRAVVDGTADGILVVDENGLVQLCNPAMATLAGLDGGEVIGRYASDILGDGPWAEEGVRDVVRPNERVWRLSVSVIQNRAHRGLRVAVVHDVTAERRVARMKDDMLSIVSHELRTPLTPIKGSAQLLRRRWERMPVEQREEMLLTIEQRADHLARLVEDLLLVGQLSASNRAPARVRPARVDIVDIAKEATTQLGRLHRGHHILLAAPDEMTLTTDPLRVRQIIDNLVNNACKFSAEDSVVQVSITTEESWAVLRVTDEGRGIPPEDLERVFERFERVEDPLNMTTSGAGLGLYIVRSLAEGLGGDVRLTSVLGTGTTVTIRLPLEIAPTPVVTA